MNLELRPYQHPMLDHFLEQPRNNMWAGMGMGKTLVALTGLDILSYVEPGRTLVIATKRVASSTWPDEVAKWPSLKGIEVSPIIGTPAARIAALKRDANIFTINYENIPWLVEHLDGKWPFRFVIADESTRLKGFRGGMQTHPKTGKVFLRAAGGIRAKGLARAAHSAVNRWSNLTGTPSPNGYQDLWGQAWYLDAGKRLGRNYGSFERSYFHYVPRFEGDTEPVLQLIPHGAEQIRAALADITLSLESKDHFKLPPLISTTHFFDLPPAAASMYRKMERDFFIQIGADQVEAFDAGAKSQKLLQLASGAVYLDVPLGHTGPKPWKEVHDVKLQILDSILSEQSGAPLLVAYNHVSDRERILRSVSGARHLDDDPGTITAWNAGKIPCLVAHPKSAGHGLNLQHGGNRITFFGHDWNLEEYLQMIERLGPTRQAQSGYDRPVFLDHIVARGTVEEEVMRRRETKKSVQELLMEAMKRRNSNG